MNEVLLEKERENVASQSIRQVRLRDFRNYASLDIAFSPGLNILFGANAQGKTNLLESIYVLATTRLLRGSKDSEAIRQGASLASAELELFPSGTEIGIVIETGKKKTANLNRLKIPRAADLIGRLPCVCISVFDMAIVQGGPEDRRLFLDLELSQLSPAYLNHLAHYKRSLEQRNALLRRAQEFSVSKEEFEPWEAALAAHGAPIRAARMGMVDELKPLAAELQAELAQKEVLNLIYETKDEARISEEFLRLLEEGREKEIQRGSTNIGPHRDDLGLIVESKDARYFGSQGQQRTAVLALKLACHLRQTSIRGQAPLLLLDDILSDLDEGRRSRLVSWLLGHARQAVLTCTEPQAAGEALLERASLFRVEAGTVTPV